MALTFTAGTSVESTGSQSSTTVTLPSGLASGDYTIIVFSLNASNGTITTPSGWTDILASTQATASSSDAHAIFYRKWVSGDTNPVISSSNGRVAATPIRVQGADGTTFIDTAASVTQAASGATTVTAPSITPTGTSLVCTFNGRSPTNGNFQTPYSNLSASMTEIAEASGKATGQTNAGHCIAYETVTAGAATGTRQVDPAVSTTGAMGVSFSIKVAAGGGQTVNAVASTVSVAAPAPAVAAGATVSGVTAAVALASPAPAVSAGANVSAVAATVNSAAPPPAVSAGANVSAVAATVNAAAPVPAVSAGATVQAVAATVTVQAPAPAVTSGGSSTVAPPAATVTVASPAAAVSAGATVSAAAATATVTSPAPAISAGAQVAAVRAMAAVTAPAPVISAGATVAPTAATVALAARAPAVSAGAAVSAVVGAVLVAAPAPSVSATGADTHQYRWDAGALRGRWSGAAGGRRWASAGTERRWKGDEVDD